MAHNRPPQTPSLLSATNGVLTVTGALTLAGLPKKAIKLPAGTQVGVMNMQGVTAMDTVGALWLLKLVREMESNDGKVKMEGWEETHRLLFEKIRTQVQKPWDGGATTAAKQGFAEKTGRFAYQLVQNLYEVTSLLGQVAVAFGEIAIGTRSFRWNAFTRHVREAGLQAMPIVMLISFLMSIVLAYQGVSQLSMFGAQRYAINLVAISTLREMGGLLAAIMVAGRSGSSFTSEIGVMKIREEVDAMTVMGLSPLDTMILPRIAALMVVLPLLTVAAFIAGITGGALMSVASLGVDLSTYFELFAGAVNGHTHWVGLVKAPVFALFIGIISCLCGLRVSGSADSVGQQTTRAVVEGIFAVLVIDALFSILFAKIGW